MERYREVGKMRIKNLVLAVSNLICLFTWGYMRLEFKGKVPTCSRIWESLANRWYLKP